MKTEPMKQRFKKRIPYADLDQLYFKDSRDDFGHTRETVGHKPHSLRWGRKPKWRAERRSARRHRTSHYGEKLKFG